MPAPISRGPIISVFLIPFVISGRFAVGESEYGQPEVHTDVRKGDRLCLS